MSFWLAILLGAIQGITEFLPVSSSGHLLIAERIFGVEVDALFLNVLLHFATLLAVLWYYRKTLWQMIKNPFCKMNLYLVIATIPAVVFVLVFGSLIEDMLSASSFVAIGFFVSAVLLSVGQLAYARLPERPLDLKLALTMGVAQAFAVFPGISRSGTTFSFGLMAGAEKKSALDFSFLMSIPIIIASLCYELVFSKIDFSLVSTNWFAIATSFLVAFLTAILGIKVMQKLVRKINFWWFVPYLVVMGAILLIWL